MQRSLCFAAVLGLFVLSAPATPVPIVLSYQGRLLVSGQLYDGEAKLRFALVAPAATAQDAAAVETLWDHNRDDVAPSVGGALPVGDGIKVQVSGGAYSVLLGSTETIPGQGEAMREILPDAVFVNRRDVRLRVWVQTPGQPVQLLTPDRRITGTAYAAVAARVEEDSVTTAMLKRGSVTSDQISAAAVGPVQLAPGAVTADRIAAGAVGSLQLAASSVTAPAVGSDAVGTTALQDQVVTAAKIKDGAVSTQHLAGSVDGSGAETTPGTVTSAKIKDGTIAAADLATGAVTWPKRAARIKRKATSHAEIAQAAIGEIAISASSGQFSTTASTPSSSSSVVPGLRISVATAGGPIMVHLLPAGPYEENQADDEAYIRVYDEQGGTMTGRIEIWRSVNGAAESAWRKTVWTIKSTYSSMAPSLSFVDHEAEPGRIYTYSVRAYSEAAAESMVVRNVALVGFEL